MQKRCRYNKNADRTVTQTTKWRIRVGLFSEDSEESIAGESGCVMRVPEILLENNQPGRWTMLCVLYLRKSFWINSTRKRVRNTSSEGKNWSGCHFARDAGTSDSGLDRIPLSNRRILLNSSVAKGTSPLTPNKKTVFNLPSQSGVRETSCDRVVLINWGKKII